MAMKKKISLVRTRCDPDDDDEPGGNQKVKAEDYKTLKKIGL